MNWGYAYVFWQSSLLETGIYFLFYRQKMSFKKCFFLVTLANAITHPIVFFGFMASSNSYLISILTAEVFAICGETALHMYGGRLSFRRALAAASAANLFSWQTAPMITYWIFLST